MDWLEKILDMPTPVYKRDAMRVLRDLSEKGKWTANSSKRYKNKFIEEELGKLNVKVKIRP